MTKAIFSTLLLLAQTYAQIPNNTLASSSNMEITFSAPSTSNCGYNYDGAGNAVTFSLTSPPTLYQCFDMNRTFTDPNVTSTANGEVQYTLTGSEHFNNAVNYSQIFYKQRVPTASEEDNSEAIGLLYLQTYNGADCLQVGPPGPMQNETLEPWIRWSCASSEGECSTLPYSVVSFAVVPVPENENDGQCVIAAVYGTSGAGRAVRNMAAVGIVAVCAALVLL